jgi:hypothetical protein
MAKNGIGPNDTPLRLGFASKISAVAMWPLSWIARPSAAPPRKVAIVPADTRVGAVDAGSPS